MTSTVGTCSLCGGRVTVPSVWMGVIPPVPPVPPVPTCEGCGAVAAEHGPVIPMRPAERWSRTTTHVTVERLPGRWSREASTGDFVFRPCELAAPKMLAPDVAPAWTRLSWDYVSFPAKEGGW